MAEQKKKPLASPETIKQLEDLQARVQTVADLAGQVQKAQKDGQTDKKALTRTLTELTTMASDLATTVMQLQKQFGGPKAANGATAAAKPSMEITRGKGGPIRG
jgi:hypothetical protein